jgi:hypothetical protein
MKTTLLKTVALSLLILTSKGFAVQNNQSQFINSTKSLQQMQNLKFDSTSASSFSIQPLDLKLPQQQNTVMQTNLVAMWKTPIPYLSVGYTVGNISVSPSNAVNLNLNENPNTGSFNALAFELSGF